MKLELLMTHNACIKRQLSPHDKWKYIPRFPHIVFMFVVVSFTKQYGMLDGTPACFRIYVKNIFSSVHCLCQVLLEPLDSLDYLGTLDHRVQLELQGCKVPVELLAHLVCQEFRVSNYLHGSELINFSKVDQSLS